MVNFLRDGSQLKNPDISGALNTLRIQYSYTQTQCEFGIQFIWHTSYDSYAEYSLLESVILC